MGSPRQDQVYYDSQQGQYYTTQNPENNSGTFSPYYRNPEGFARDMYSFIGVSDANNPFGAAPMLKRNYLGNPKVSDYNYLPYDQLTNLFPSLNAGLNNNPQSLLSPADTQSSGVGRFLSSNTQGK